METPQPQEDLLKEIVAEMEENKFLYCFGESTKEEKEYLIKTGQLIERDGEYFNISTLSESGFANDLDESILDLQTKSGTTPSNPKISLSPFEKSRPVTPQNQSTTATATPARVKKEELVAENTFIGLDDVNMFQTPLARGVPKSATGNSKELVAENTFIGLDDVNMFQTPLARDVPMSATQNSKSFTTSRPAIEFCTPTNSATANSSRRCSKTFSGSKNKSAVLQDTMQNVSLDFLNVEDSSITSLNECGLANDLDEPILDLHSKSGTTGSDAKINTNSSFEKSQPATPQTNTATATPARVKNEELVAENTFIGLDDVNMFQTPLARNGRKSATGNSKELVTENTFIGLDDVNMFQTPLAMDVPKTATGNSKEVVAENTFIGLDDVNMFQTPLARDVPTSATGNSKSFTISRPVLEFCTPTNSATANASRRRSKTFSGSKNKPAVLQDTMQNVSLDLLDVEDCNIASLNESGLANDLHEPLMDLQSSGITPSNAKNSMSSSFQKSRLATPLNQNTTATPIPASVNKEELVAENTYIGLDDVNMFQTPTPLARHVPMSATQNSKSFTTSRPVIEFCTPTNSATANASRRRSKTFSGSKNKSAVLQDTMQNVSLDLLNVEDSSITSLSDSGLANDLDEHILDLHSKSGTTPSNSKISMSSSFQKSRHVTPQNTTSTATPVKRAGLVRENTFIGLDDVNLFQTPLARNVSTSATRNSKSFTTSTSRPLIEFCTPTNSATANASRRLSKTCSGSKNNSAVLQNKKQNMSLDLLKFEDSSIISELSQEQQGSVNLMILDSSKDCSKNTTSSKEDLDDTIETMEKLLAMADEEEAKEANLKNIEIVQDTPAKCSSRHDSILATPSLSPSPLKSKRLLQLKGKNTLFSPSPPRPGPLPSSASTPIFKTPTSRPKTPKFHGSSPSRKYADIPAKVDSGLRKSPSGFSLGLDSPVAEYIHSKAAPSPFQRVTGIPNRIMSTGKPMNAKPVGTTMSTMIPRPSLPSLLTGSSKFNSQLLSAGAGMYTDVKFKELQYTGSKATMINNASFAEKHQKENYVAERHTGVRAENVDVSLVQGGVIEKKFLGQKHPKFQSQLRLPHNYHL